MNASQIHHSVQAGRAACRKLCLCKVDSHRHLVEGYVKVHGGGWYEKDDEKKTMLLYGSFGDYGEPRLDFLNRIPSELKGYKFLYSHDWGKTSSELDVSGVEWI